MLSVLRLTADVAEADGAALLLLALVLVAEALALLLELTLDPARTSPSTGLRETSISNDWQTSLPPSQRPPQRSTDHVPSSTGATP
jgi:hypothetical protein